MCSDCGNKYGTIVNCSAPPLNKSYSVCAKLRLSLIIKRGCAIPKLGKRYTVSTYRGSLSYADLSNAVLSSADFWKDSKNFEQYDFIL